MLVGAEGPTAAAAMGLLVRFAETVQAPHLIEANAAHIDDCLYDRQVSLDFVEHFVRLGAAWRVRTTLNGSVDPIHPGLFQVGAEVARDGAGLMRTREELGCVPTFTCAVSENSPTSVRGAGRQG
jgi:predicted aconitase